MCHSVRLSEREPVTKGGHTTHPLSLSVSCIGSSANQRAVLSARLDADWPRESGNSILMTLDFVKVFIGLFSYFRCFFTVFLVYYHSESLHTMASGNRDHDESFSGQSGLQGSITRSMFYDCGSVGGESDDLVEDNTYHAEMSDISGVIGGDNDGERM